MVPEWPIVPIYVHKWTRSLITLKQSNKEPVSHSFPPNRVERSIMAIVIDSNRLQAICPKIVTTQLLSIRYKATHGFVFRPHGLK